MFVGARVLRGTSDLTGAGVAVFRTERLVERDVVDCTYGRSDRSGGKSGGLMIIIINHNHNHH